MIGFGKRGASKQDQMPGLKLLGEFLTAAGEFLRSTKIADHDRIGVLRER